MTSTLAVALAALALAVPPPTLAVEAGPALSLYLPRSPEPGRAPAPDLRGVLRQEEQYPPAYADEDTEDERRVFLSVWGGEAFDAGGAGRSYSLLGAEAAWAFSSLDLGLAGYGYRNLPDSTRTWTPVALLKLTQRFGMRGGTEATFSFGAGAAHPAGWIAWYQVALGIRVPLGPAFLGGELAFEQYDLLRLIAGLGVAF